MRARFPLSYTLCVPTPKTLYMTDFTTAGDARKLRNIAIVAHVDHGKTTLVDKLLRLSGTLDRKELESGRVLDSNHQEQERGITILAKNTALQWKDYDVNIVDAPAHDDLGREGVGG